MKVKDILEFEEEYWKPISDSEGKLLPEYDGAFIKKEMFDYFTLMKNSSQVYGAITGGKIRDTRSEPDVVINCASSMIADQINDLSDQYISVIEEEIKENSTKDV